MQGFARVVPDIPVCDIWPEQKLTKGMMEAYRDLDAAKRIMIKYPIKYLKDRGRVMIEYLSPVPEEWIHQEIRTMALRKEQTHQTQIGA